jgi:hypothetical protein
MSAKPLTNAPNIFERIKFEAWAGKNDYYLQKAEAFDFSGMPAYLDPDTYAAWAGWMGKKEHQ